MEQVSHYCLSGESHADECDCQCGSCNRRRKDLEQNEFNRRLSKAIEEQNRRRFED